MNDRAWIEVNQENLLSNLELIQKSAGRSKIMAVVKDNCYGLGLDAILLLQEQGVDFFATATISEAITLREAGIDQNILILGYTDPRRFNELVQYQLHQTLISKEYALEIADYSSKHQPIACHLKINTGMNRLGIKYDELDEMISLYQNDNLNITGIFSHLFVADELNDEGEELTLLQINRFKEVIKLLEQNNINVGLTHLYNSYGLLFYSDTEQFDYCRPGLIFNGCADYPGFKNVLTLKAKIVMVKEVLEDQYVSYGFVGHLDAPKKIATVGIGYGDGLERRLNQTDYSFTVNNQLVKPLGRMCMDILMVDVTEVDNVKAGDVVELINDKHTVFDMAKALDTIPYEILTHLMGRLPRL